MRTLVRSSFVSAFCCASFLIGSVVVAGSAAHAVQASKKDVAEASFKVGKAPAGLPAEALAAMKRIEHWCEVNDYSLTPCADGRVLLVTTLDGKALQGRLQLVRQLCSSFEALLPMPKRGPVDPDAPVAEWGVLHQPEQGAVLLIEAANAEHYGQLVDELKVAAQGNEALAYLADWFEHHRNQPGFVSTNTLTSAWQTAPRDIEEDTVWRTNNEMLNRLAQLLVYRRFGDVPHWLRTGLSWHFEQQLTSTIHCFPSRDGFVSVDGDHDGWQDALSNEFKGRKKSPLAFSEFGDWKRGTWDDQRAAHAWGMVEYLVAKEPAKLGEFLESLRAFRAKESIVTDAEGNWRLKPDYEIPLREQQRMLEDKVGKDCLAKASAFFIDWKGWNDPVKSKGSASKGKK